MVAPSVSSWGLYAPTAAALHPVPNANVLPVTATYVIGRDVKSKFAFFDAYYRHRASVHQVGQAL